MFKPNGRLSLKDVFQNDEILYQRLTGKKTNIGGRSDDEDDHDG